MSVSKQFQNQVGTIKLADLDTNFSQIDSRATSLETRATSLETRTTEIEGNVVNFNHWTFEEVAGVLYFKYDGVAKLKLDSSGNITVVSTVTSYGTL
jgi:hypothetical protein